MYSFEESVSALYALEDYESERKRPARIVLAEDDSAMRELVATVLRKDGYEVVEVEDGEELLRCLRSSRSMNYFTEIDLVISDIRMPAVDGLRVLSDLRQFDWNLPVILITAFGNSETHAEAARLGAACVLDKPFEIENLRYCVKKILPR